MLGAVFLDNATLAQLPRLEVADFYDPRHKAVFQAMRNLEARNQPIDAITVEAEIARAGIRAVTSIDIAQIVLCMPTVDNAIEYARQIRDAHLARKVAVVAGEIIANQHLEGAELLSMAWALLSKLDEDQPDTTRAIGELVRGRFKQLEHIASERLAGREVMTGCPTGVRGLDEKLGGWQPGIVSIVAARPGMGKSSLGLATARASSEAGHGVHVFSLEDTEAAYCDRTLSGESGVPAERLRSVTLDRGQTDDIARAFVKLRGRRWLVDDRSGITADEIVRSVRRHRKQNQTRVVIVDYVQLVARPRGSRLSRHEELTDIVTTLANAAKHDGLAYVVMSQLNRQLESRADKRPQLSDLRESGSLEERAKCVVCLYRGSMYGGPVRGVDWDPAWKQPYCYEPDPEEFNRTVQLGVVKNSNGRTGSVFASWHGETTRIA